MNKITVKLRKERIEFGINQYKYLIGSNYSDKHQIVQSIKKCFERGNNSEFAIDNNSELWFKINDKDVDIRKYKLFNITSIFDYKTEIKLGAKSIILNYLEAIFKDIEYDDLVNTLRIIKDDLGVSMSDRIEQNNHYKLNLKFEEITLKGLLKQVEVSLYKDQLISNEYDLSYEDLVLFQIDLITKITENIRDFEYICIIEIPVVTQIIKEAIEKVKQKNLMILIVSNDSYIKNVDINNFLSLNKQIIDFSDEVSIYNDIILNLERNSTIQDIREHVSLYFNSEGRQDDLNLSKIL
ncbi:conserved hypothetical protein [Alteracholeplasma palmae J233]|uniref:Uncharacterized protein n=1 Tax=Alteracholeplasma palmae (strain ATCC 49389 / J233) TaxID=1318466 RepID=U4KR47_ALTPJ|nr:hypothetical protein [Alteracholeplasma palmae]CCV63866.1 conserved hypothetical protein [Alteracholeplasma palmae J233]